MDSHNMNVQNVDEAIEVLYNVVADYKTRNDNELALLAYIIERAAERAERIIVERRWQNRSIEQKI